MACCERKQGSGLWQCNMTVTMLKQRKTFEQQDQSHWLSLYNQIQNKRNLLHTQYLKFTSELPAEWTHNLSPFHNESMFFPQFPSQCYVTYKTYHLTDWHIHQVRQNATKLRNYNVTHWQRYHSTCWLNFTLPQTDQTNIWHLLGANFGPCAYTHTHTHTDIHTCVHRGTQGAWCVCVWEHYFLFLISSTGSHKNLILAIF